MPELGIQKRSFFLYGVTLSLSKYSGYRADLHCCNKEAFDLQAGASGKSASTKPKPREVWLSIRGLEKQRTR